MKNHYIPEKKFPMKLDDTLYVLGNYFFNLFLIIGKNKSVLFEVGISAVVDTVISQLEQLGIRPDYLIPSHPHSDHITGLPGLAMQYPKARVVVGKGAREFIEHPKAKPLLVKEDAFMSKSLAGLNIKPGRPGLQDIPDLDNSMVIEDHTTLDLGNTALELKKVTGHSPGNLIGFIHQKKILFSSDSLGFHFPGRGFLPLFFTRTDAYLDTLSFIKEFDPSIICPAHQGPLKGEVAKTGIQASIDTSIALIKKIKQSRRSDDALAMEIFEQSYKDEFTLYTEANIKNCAALLVKRAKEAILNIT